VPGTVSAGDGGGPAGRRPF